MDRGPTRSQAARINQAFPVRTLGETLRLKAPAKVNLRLRVVGKRADGYHLLESIMLPVALFDEIEIRPSESGEIALSVDGDGAGVPTDSSNLVVRAVEALAAEIGRPIPVRIRLTKRIPVAAGLGGGSSDAAIVLKGINEALGSPLTDERLEEIGVGLGADVPFFIRCRPAIATGIGEQLEMWQFTAPAWFLLVNPGFAVSTAEVFRNVSFRLTNQVHRANLPKLVSDVREIRSLLVNDLEPATFNLYPEVRRVRELLSDRAPHGSMMSGSGPTVFGVFASREEGDRQRRDLSRVEAGWRTFLVPPF